MKYLIDTDRLIDVFVGIPHAIRTLEGFRPERIGVSIVSYAEIFEGAFGFPDTEDRLALYREFLGQYETISLSDPIAEIFGRTRSGLRRSWRAIPDLDLLIGATAVHHELILLTRNVKHFARIPDLQLYGSI